MILRTLILWLHVVSMVAWFGGLLFYVVVAAPAARTAKSASDRLHAFADLDQRFRHVIWGSVEAAVVTGIALLVITMLQAGTTMHLSGSYMRVLAAKLLLAVVVIGMQLHNHVRINPRKRALAEAAGAGAAGSAQEPPEFGLLQERTRQIYALELVLAAGVVLLGVHMRAVL